LAGIDPLANLSAILLDMGIATRSLPSLTAAYLLAAFAVSEVSAQTSPNADICAAGDDSAYSPEQRIAACTALIGASKNQPGELAAALVNCGTVYYYVNRMPLAFADLHRAIGLDGAAIVIPREFPLEDVQ
jgi:hypothetical protein